MHPQLPHSVVLPRTNRRAATRSYFDRLQAAPAAPPALRASLDAPAHDAHANPPLTSSRGAVRAGPVPPPSGPARTSVRSRSELPQSRSGLRPSPALGPSAPLDLLIAATATGAVLAVVATAILVAGWPA